MNPEPPLWEARQDMYRIEFYGTSRDGKPAAYNIGSHFETIDAAANKARKIGNADTFHWGKAAGYRIRDKRKAVVFEGTFDANWT
jgi:hypothetical protein